MSAELIAALTERREQLLEHLDESKSRLSYAREQVKVFESTVNNLEGRIDEIMQLIDEIKSEEKAPPVLPTYHTLAGPAA